MCNTSGTFLTTTRDTLSVGVGDARNETPHNRTYFSTGSIYNPLNTLQGRTLELTYKYPNSNGWNYVDTGGDTNYNLEGAHETIIIKAKNNSVGAGFDEKYRLYVAAETGGGSLNEFTFTTATTAWSHLRLNASTVTTGVIRGLVSGSARADGLTRLYVSTKGGSKSAFEFEWNGTVWVETLMGATSEVQTDIALGKGRNDSKDRVCVTTIDGKIFEYTNTSNTTVWDAPVNMGSPILTFYNSVEVGPGSNDSTNNVFVGSNDGMVYEYIYNSILTTWEKIEIGPVGGKVNDIKIIQGRNDGVYRLYVSGDDMRVWEFTAQ